MVDRDVVAAKLAEVEKRLTRIRSKCPASAAELSTDSDTLELVSFNLILAVQACLDIASHLIADEGWAVAPTLAEPFVRLEEHHVISAETSRSLQFASKMRNVLTHLYSQVDPDKVHEAATTGLVDLQSFAREISGWVRRLPAS